MLTVFPPQVALDGEMALLDTVCAAPTRTLLGFWQAPQALVAPIGFRHKPGIEAACAASAARGWPVSFRCTGGDVTPQGPGIGNVTLSYALPVGARRNIAATFDTLCDPFFALLGPGAQYGYVEGAFCDGAYNINIGGRKFAGTAQRYRRAVGERRQTCVLSHAILVLTPPKPEVFEALNSFLSDLDEGRVIRAEQHTGLPARFTPDQFFAALEDEFRKHFPKLERADLPGFRPRQAV